MNPLNIATSRLELVAASLKLGEAELVDRREFSRLLDAEIPENWPPPDNDETNSYRKYCFAGCFIEKWFPVRGYGKRRRNHKIRNNKGRVFIVKLSGSQKISG